MSKWTPADVKGLIANPVYAGMGPFAALVSEEVWLEAVLRLMARQGESATIDDILAQFQEVFPLLVAPDADEYVQQAKQDPRAALCRLLMDLRELAD